MHSACVWAHFLHCMSPTSRRHRVLLRRQLKHAACFWAPEPSPFSAVFELDGERSSMSVIPKGRSEDACTLRRRDHAEHRYGTINRLVCDQLQVTLSLGIEWPLVYLGPSGDEPMRGRGLWRRKPRLRQLFSQHVISLTISPLSRNILTGLVYTA